MVGAIRATDYDTTPDALIAAFERMARARLKRTVYGYFAGGAGREQTLDDAEQAWQRLWLRPRVLAGVGDVDTSIELLGERLPTPIVLAPVAVPGFARPEGELALARAAERTQTPFCMPTRATHDLAEVAHAAPRARRWFQLYMHADRSHARHVLERAKAAGYQRIVLTVDLAVGALRARESSTAQLESPDGVAIADHLQGGGLQSTVKPVPGSGWDRALAWEDIAWTREAAQLPVIVKGILTAEDATLAVENGAEAIVVSTHGGRQLDGAIPSPVALPEIVAAVDGRVPVLVDGGIRSGADIARALALGATAVLIGRPWLWALAAAGEEGIVVLLSLLQDDLARTLALLGCRAPAEVSRDHVAEQTNR